MEQIPPTKASEIDGFTSASSTSKHSAHNHNISQNLALKTVIIEENDKSMTHSTVTSISPVFNSVLWSNEDHELFLKGLRMHGRNWALIKLLLKTKSEKQISDHADEYLAKFMKNKPLPANKMKRKLPTNITGNTSGDSLNNHSMSSGLFSLINATADDMTQVANSAPVFSSSFEGRNHNWPVRNPDGSAVIAPHFTHKFPPLDVYTSSMQAIRTANGFQSTDSEDMTSHPSTAAKRRAPGSRTTRKKSKVVNNTNNGCSSSSTDDSFTLSHLRAASLDDRHQIAWTDNYLTLQGSFSMDVGDTQHRSEAAGTVNRTPFVNVSSPALAMGTDGLVLPNAQVFHAQAVSTMMAPGAGVPSALFSPSSATAAPRKAPPAFEGFVRGTPALVPATRKEFVSLTSAPAVITDSESPGASQTAAAFAAPVTQQQQQQRSPHAIDYSFEGVMSSIHSPLFSTMLGQYPDLSSVLAAGVSLEEESGRGGGKLSAFPPLQIGDSLRPAPLTNLMRTAAPPAAAPRPHVNTVTPKSMNVQPRHPPYYAQSLVAPATYIAPPVPVPTSVPVVEVPLAADPSTGYSSGYVLVSRSRDINSNNKKSTKGVNSAIIGLNLTLNGNGKRTYAGKEGFRTAPLAGHSSSSANSGSGSHCHPSSSSARSTDEDSQCGSQSGSDAGRKVVGFKTDPQSSLIPEEAQARMSIYQQYSDSIHK